MGQDYGIDAYEIMTWPLKKIYRYMSFYISQSDSFKAKEKKNHNMSFEEICHLMEKEGFLDE